MVNFQNCRGLIIGSVASLLMMTDYAFAQQREFFNGGFEFNDPDGPGAPSFEITDDDLVDEWSATTNEIELWDSGFLGVDSYEGDVHAEMNANVPGTLFQEVCLIQGETLGWFFAHRAREGGSGDATQTAILEIRNNAGGLVQALATQSSDQGDDWATNSGVTTYTGPTGGQRAQFRSASSSSFGNFIDSLQLNIAAFAEFTLASSSDEERPGGNIPIINVNGRLEVDTDIPINVTGGTATSDDYTLTSSVLTIPAGLYNNVSFPIPLVINDNFIAEDDETIIFELGTPSTGEVIYARTECDGAPPQTSATYTIINDDPIIAARKDVELYNPDGLNLYALPGNDVVYTISVTNEGEIDLDEDTVFLSDRMPSEVEFFTGDIDGVAGPQTGPIAFINNSSGLSFSAADDVKYSNLVPAPADITECNYTPNGTYDPLVKHICFAPKGIFQAGDPDPSFSFQFRARIK